MEYSIYKDDKTENTVFKIKDILKNLLGLELEEDIFEAYSNNGKGLYSVRVKIPLTNIGTNGKGTTLSNALASGYAEFMERLQNNILISIDNKEFIIAPDEKIYTLKQLLCSEISKFLPENSLRNLNKYINIRDKLKTDKVVMTPFYSLKSQKEVDLPFSILLKIQGSNGMAAGNTIEEAMVQGFSEICERYAVLKIFSEKIVMPDIPKSEYEHYENIMNIIKYLEKKGYEISIKDASLGKKIPVVCLLFKDTKNETLSVGFASQPSLPVSIERCLTEFAQGFKNIENKKLYSDFYITESEYKYFYEMKIFSIIERIFEAGLTTKLNKYLEDQFYSEKVSYDFSKSAWFSETENITNKELLEFLISSISNITDNSIYVRDMSFLGFPAFYIFIPEISNIHIFNEERFNSENNLLICNKYIGQKVNSNKKNKMLDVLLSVFEYKIQYLVPSNIDISILETIYYILLCSIALNDKVKTKFYTQIMLEKNKSIRFLKGRGLKLVYYIYDLYSMKLKNIEEEKIIDNLKLKYQDEEINLFNNFIKNLCFETIEQMILPHIKSSKKTLKDTDLYKKLISIYKKNIPSQLELKRFFDNLNI